MGEVDWGPQEKVWEEIKGLMREAMLYISRELRLGQPDEWDHDHDCGYVLIARRDDNTSLEISFKLIDSGEYDTGIYGEAGNIQIDVVEYGGRIVGGWAPYNYTDKVWVDYEDVEEFESRVRMIADQWFGIVELVKMWKEEAENE